MGISFPFVFLTVLHSRSLTVPVFSPYFRRVEGDDDVGKNTEGSRITRLGDGRLCAVEGTDVELGQGPVVIGRPEGTAVR